MAFNKTWLFINGAKRMVTFDPEKDNLAVVLRRLGLTGTKIGCGVGQCGACTVIYNGEVIRACVKRMSQVEANAKITTIEGIGTPDHLHPLQVAWNTYGAVQCGFCSPGFIVSAKGLLDQNPSPTRQEVRDWFTSHNNLCRCTGYKPIVDAVMAAAAVLRGERTIEDITYHVPENGENVYGTAFPRRESGIARVTGLANYGDDISYQMRGEFLEVAPVIPDVAHAIIKGIDDTEAMKVPGVVKVVTAKDVKGTNRVVIPTGHPRALAAGDERPIICDKKVFKYGDIVALVVADNREAARKAAKLVKVDYEELPTYANQLEAMHPDAMQIHEGVPNVLLRTPLHKGKDTREIMETAAHVVEGSYSTVRQPHLTIEPDVCQAYMGDDGVLVIQYKAQFVYGNIWFIADGIGLPQDKIRVIQNETGGSFGYSVSPHTSAVAAVASLAVGGRPVSMTLTYPEHMHVTGKRAGSNSNIRLACDEKGKIQALEYHISYEMGAYTEFVQSLLAKALYYGAYGYYVPNAQAIAQACYSNFSFFTTYRAFSAVQVMTATESIMDKMADELGMDPFEFRYQNIVRPGDTNLNGVPYNEYPHEEMMEMLRPKYYEVKARCEERNKTATDKRYGVGLALGGYTTGDPVDQSTVSLELMPDGTFVHYGTWQDVGQHGEAGLLLHTFKALAPMNVPLEKINYVQNDTAMCPNSGIAGGSSSHFKIGLATIDAANKLMDAMRKEDGTYRTYDEMVAEGIPTRYDGSFSTPQGATCELSANDGQGRMFDACLYNIFMAEVEVDLNTGKTKVLSMACVGDVGQIGNLLGVEGQAYGGLSHGVGMALTEDYSDMKRDSTPRGAGIPVCNDIPDDITLLWHQSYRENGPHGSVGASENFQSAGHVAILNAINQAAGVQIHETPARPEKVKAALEAKAQGKAYEPEAYYLGGDFYDLLDEMAANPVPDDVNRRYMRLAD